MTVLAVVFVLLLVACAGCDEEELCVPDLPTSCDPMYSPTLDDIHTQTFADSCALSGCHDAETAEEGLDLSTPDAAYASLVEGGRVTPGDAACSTLMLRLEGYELDPMPPSTDGQLLDEAERCAIQMWIDAGAER